MVLNLLLPLIAGIKRVGFEVEDCIFAIKAQIELLLIAFIRL